MFVFQTSLASLAFCHSVSRSVSNRFYLQHLKEDLEEIAVLLLLAVGASTL